MGYSPSVVVSASDRVVKFIHHTKRDGGALQFFRVALVIGALLLVGAVSAHAGTFTAFGPQNYTRGTGAPVTVTKTFSVLNPNTQYTLHIEAQRVDEDKDQDSDDHDPHARARILLNGSEIVDFDDFHSAANPILLIDKPIKLLNNNTIAVEVRGKRGTSVTVSIIGVDNDPPTLKATVSPAPNAAGWNNTNVTVTFVCADATSPVISCPAPQTVTTKGANQIITGTATDAAGNSASTRVTLNIDKTPPVVTAALSPAANAAGWNNSNVTVSFTCTDSLSGVAHCPSSTTVTTEGANQTVSGTATDVAGNTASTSVTVKLDKTPPTISITSPANGATFTSSSAAVTGTVSDALSGVATVACNGAPAIVQSGAFNCSITLAASSNTITAQAIDVAGNTASASENVTFANTPPPAITSFSPTSASIGNQVTVTGSNFTANGTGTPQITLSQQRGGSITAPISSFTATTISFVIPAGAASGPLTVTTAKVSAVSAASLSVVPSSSFSVSAAPASTIVQQGTRVSYSVSLSSSSGFSQLAALSVAGVPSGVTASFSPTQITAAQTSILTITAPANQPVGSATLTVSAAATVEGIPTTQSASVNLAVQAASTSLIGRTVESDSNETPIGGITLTFLGVDDAGNHTACSGQTRSDAAGNFAFNNLSSSCLGRQLVGFNGNTATDGEKYASVNLAYTMISGQITGPELVHLPAISDAETIMVTQNATVDQVFTYSTIPGVVATVYAGTTLTLPDGTQPNPFPMAAVLVPVDRLPDAPPPTTGTLRASIVAFQPADTTSNLPVSVTFPNIVNSPPGVNMELDTLDPIVGELVKYGTGTVSSDASLIIPDADPAHPGHRFGITHFDWHGPMAPSPNGNNPSPDPDCPCSGDPINLATGLQVVDHLDLRMSSVRGNVAITRTYRTLSGNPGPFGIGTNHNYGYLLDTSNLIRGTGTFVALVMPDGNQFTFSQQGANTFVNSTVPTLLGAVITSPSSGTFNLRWKDGSVYQFQTSSQGVLLAFLSSVTDANGNTTSIVRGNPSQPIQITQIIDTVGRALNLTYDNFNRILSIADPIGRKVQYTYNLQGTLATFTDTAGGIMLYSYDGQNRLTSITNPRNIVAIQNGYDSNGRVIQQIAADGGTTKLSYTLINPTVPSSPVLLTSVTDPRGDTTLYHFNPQGFVIDITDTLGEKTVYARDPGSNELLSITDPLGRTTSFTYDAEGNKTSITRLANTPGAVTSSFTYDPTFSKVTSVTDPLGHTTALKYDTAGNLTSVTNPLHEQQILTYDSAGELTATTDPLGNVLKFAYSNGNIASMTDPLGRPTVRVTDGIGRVAAITNALGQTTKYQYDALDRATQITDSFGNHTSYTYDGNGNLLSVIDANQNTTGFTYDSMDRLTRRTDALSNVETRQYDLNGNVTQVTDRRGIMTQYGYDALNRKITAQFGNESSVGYSYDAASRLIEANDSLAGTILRGYDNLDRLHQETTAQGTISYSYDSAGRRTNLNIAGQKQVSYEYDDANRLIQIAQGSSNVTIAYDNTGRRTSLTLPNGVTMSYSYDSASELSAINYQLGSAALGSLDYTYDLAGRRVSMAGSFARTALPPASSGSYNGNNQLTQWQSTNLSYDGNGNLTSNGASTNVWDARSRLTTISAGNQTASFRYDGLGRRMESSIGATVKSYLYDGKNIVQEMSDDVPSASLLTGLRVDERFARTDAGGTTYFLADALGSTLGLTDSSGALQTAYTYEPFGTTTSSNPSANVFEFTGRENDQDGLYYYRARYYNPSLQRFISEDPIGIRGGINLYAYVGNDPILHSDPLGLLRDCSAEQIECFNECYNRPTRCLPWPVGRGGGKSAKWSRYSYCQTKCLAEFMECEAENAAEQTAKFCSQNPGTCVVAGAVVIIGGTVIIIGTGGAAAPALALAF